MGIVLAAGLEARAVSCFTLIALLHWVGIGSLTGFCLFQRFQKIEDVCKRFYFSIAMMRNTVKNNKML